MKKKTVLSTILASVLLLSLGTGCALRSQGHNRSAASDAAKALSFLSGGAGAGQGAMQNAAAPQTISDLQALEIALSDAGLSASEVTVTKNKADLDDGRLEYDIEFVTSAAKYDYDIDAASGAILSKEVKELKKPTVQEPESDQRIGEEKALEIALSDANVAASDATVTKNRLDHDDGRTEYDIEFVTATAKYDYDIDAASGAILSKEVKELKKPQSDDSSATRLSPEQALSIAFSRIGPDATAARVLENELDKEDGRLVYSLELYANGLEYEIEIDALSGEIVSYEEDRAD